MPKIFSYSMTEILLSLKQFGRMFGRMTIRVHNPICAYSRAQRWVFRKLLAFSARIEIWAPGEKQMLTTSEDYIKMAEYDIFKSRNCL